MKKILYLLLLVNLGLPTAYCQASKIDSLLTRLKTAKDDTNKVNLLLKLGDEYENVKAFEKELNSGYDALALSKSIKIGKIIGWNLGVANAYANISSAYFQQGNFDKSIENMIISIKIKEVIGNKEDLSNSYFNLGLIYNYHGDYDKGIEIYNKALKIQKDLGNKQGILKSLGNIGIMYSGQGNYLKALENYFAVIKLQESLGDKQGIAGTYQNIGSVYYHQKNYEKALENWLSAKKIYEAYGNKRRIPDLNNNIGVIYAIQGKHDKVIELYLASLKIFEDRGDKQNISRSLGNLGVAYNAQGNKEKALETYFAAAKIQEEIGDENALAGTYNNIGNRYAEEENYTKAFQYYFDALKLEENNGDKEGAAYTYNYIGNLYLEKGNVIEAKKNLLLSLKVIKEIGAKDFLSAAYESLSQCDSAAGDYKGAYEYFKLHKAMNDSIFNIESSEKTATMTAMYESEKKEAQIQLLEKDKEKQTAVAAADKKRLLAEADKNMAVAEADKKTAMAEADKKTAMADKKRILAETDKNNTLLEADKNMAISEVEKKKQRTIIYAVIGGLLLLIIFSIFMFNRWRITQRQKVIIEQKEKETNFQKELIEEKHKEITDSINYAERIQRSFLATTDMLDQHLRDYFVFFRPKDVVSGDFYWAGELNNGNFAFSVADSTGHGVPGAIMSILNISSLEKSIEKETAPEQILNKTRKIIIERLKKDGSSEGGKDGMDCSLLVLNQDRTQLSFAAANNPVFIVRNKELIEFKPDKMPVGKHDNDAESFTLHSTLLQKGDVIYALTDGFPDQFGGDKGKKYMIKNLKELLLQIAHLTVQEQEQKLADEFTAWKGENEQVDDVCIIGVRV